MYMNCIAATWIKYIETSFSGTHIFLYSRIKNDSFFTIIQRYDQVRFRDTIQTKAYQFDGLVGNMGGYMGLFLGYALINLPNFFDIIVMVTKKVITGKNVATKYKGQLAWILMISIRNIVKWLSTSALFEYKILTELVINLDFIALLNHPMF